MNPCRDWPGVTTSRQPRCASGGRQRPIAHGTSLTEAEHETELGKRLFGVDVGGLVDSGTRIGDAVLHTKRDLAEDYPNWKTDGTNWRDVILGWQLLGDPLLRITP